MENQDWGPSAGETACRQVLEETRALFRFVLKGDPEARRKAQWEFYLLDTYKPGMKLRAVVPGRVGGHRKRVVDLHGRLMAVSILKNSEGSHDTLPLGDWINATAYGVEPTPPEGVCEHCGKDTWYEEGSEDYQICGTCRRCTVNKRGQP